MTMSSYKIRQLLIAKQNQSIVDSLPELCDEFVRRCKEEKAKQNSIEFYEDVGFASGINTAIEIFEELFGKSENDS